jgi:hypothetical protein
MGWRWLEPTSGPSPMPSQVARISESSLAGVLREHPRQLGSGDPRHGWARLHLVHSARDARGRPVSDARWHWAIGKACGASVVKQAAADGMFMAREPEGW